MLLLIMMLLMGLAAGVCGFMACFLPARWYRLTELISFADRWTESSPKRLHPVVRFLNRVSGLVIFAVGCWFVYMAGTEIWLVHAGQATSPVLHPASGEPHSTPTPGITALSIFVVVAGILMAVFPAKALAVFGHVWPVGRSVTPSAAPRVMLVLRLCGVFFAFLAFMSLFH